jgi:hypothetical protein
LFDNAPYRIIGFAENSAGEVSVVLEQPYIISEREATGKEIKDYLKDRGFREEEIFDDSGWSVHGWTNDIYDIWDAEPKNVLADKNGNLYFIDTVVNHTWNPTDENNSNNDKEQEQIDIANIENKIVVSGTINGFTVFDNKNRNNENAGTDMDVRPTRDLFGHKEVRRTDDEAVRKYHEPYPFTYIFTDNNKGKQYLVATAGLNAYGQSKNGRFGNVFVSVEYTDDLAPGTEEYLLRKAVDLYHEKFDKSVKSLYGNQVPVVEFRPEYLSGFTTPVEANETTENEQAEEKPMTVEEIMARNLEEGNVPEWMKLDLDFSPLDEETLRAEEEKARKFIEENKCGTLPPSGVASGSL